MTRSLPLLISLMVSASPTAAFEFPTLPSFFTPPSKSPSLGKKKAALLEAISNTQNGKTASAETQAAVLRMVRDIELEAPPAEDLLSNPEEAVKLDGVWYLQYTSPSEVEETANGADDDAWTPVDAAEGDSNIPTNADGKFQARGSVAAGGLVVDTSDRPVLQTFDVANGLVANDVTLPNNARVSVGGRFRPSDVVPNRAIVAFTSARVTVEVFGRPLTLTLDPVFQVLELVRGTADNGWLETTHVSDDVRIGRGNKGTMFVLTREQDAVSP